MYVYLLILSWGDFEDLKIFQTKLDRVLIFEGAVLQLDYRCRIFDWKVWGSFPIQVI